MSGVLHTDSRNWKWGRKRKRRGNWGIDNQGHPSPVAQGQAPYSVQCRWIHDPESSKTFLKFTSIGNNNKEHITETDLFEEDCQPKLKCKKFSHLKENNSQKFILKGTDKLTVALDSGRWKGSSPHFLEVASTCPAAPKGSAWTVEKEWESWRRVRGAGAGSQEMEVVV